MHRQQFYSLIIIALLIASCSLTKKESEKDQIINVATSFLEIVKTNDTAKVRDNLYYGLIGETPEMFATKTTKISRLLLDSNISDLNNITVSSDRQNTPTYSVVYRLIDNNQSISDTIKIEVNIQKIGTVFKVVLFDYEFFRAKLLDTTND